MYVEAVNYHLERLEILLSGEDTEKTLKVLFEFPLSFRVTRESYFFNAFESLGDETLGKVFYMVENSKYIDLFNKWTGNAYPDWEVKHYAIYVSLDCIDVLSSYPPIIEWV